MVTEKDAPWVPVFMFPNPLLLYLFFSHSLTTQDNRLVGWPLTRDPLTGSLDFSVPI